MSSFMYINPIFRIRPPFIGGLLFCVFLREIERKLEKMSLTTHIYFPITFNAFTASNEFFGSTWIYLCVVENLLCRITSLMTYADIISETMSTLHNQSFRNRINRYLEESGGIAIGIQKRKTWNGFLKITIFKTYTKAFPLKCRSFPDSSLICSKDRSAQRTTVFQKLFVWKNSTPFCRGIR